MAPEIVITDSLAGSLPLWGHLFQNLDLQKGILMMI